VSQLALAARLGWRIPRTVTTSEPQALLDFYEACGGRIIAKASVPLELAGREGEKREPYTRPVRRRDLLTCRALRHGPVTFQEYVAKRAELRVTVVGDRVFAAEIDSQASPRTRHDWRHYDNTRARYSVHALPPDVEALCVAVTRALGLCYGAIDLILTPDGEYVFLEINPNGQWAWVEELTTMPIADAIADLLTRGRPPAQGPPAAAAAGHPWRSVHAAVSLR
jgi:glutathione synthase/RimK-type ligase-like ATP-grasp enzyme